jgi:transcriptional regulator with XRE-family HTH domain
MGFKKTMNKQYVQIEPMPVEIGNRIKVYRDTIGLNQKDFAEKIGMSASYVSEIESGKHGIGFSFLIRLASAVNINLNWLLTGKGNIFVKDSGKKNSILENFDFGDQTENILEILECFNKSPLVQLTVISFARKFMLTHESIIQKDIEKHAARRGKGKK